MAIKKIRIAVISDLHCHPKRTREEGKDESYLLTDKLRIPSNDHPVDDLLNLVKNEELEVDLTLCPGDFTDKANVQGFISGWGFSLEINRSLNARKIIATLGNHDVDVYGANSNYTLDIAKGIKQGFPIADVESQNVFWSKGCVFVEDDDYRILVINSSHFHQNKESAKLGKVSDELLEYVESYLKINDDSKIKIVMSHHHPIDHSRRKLGETDKIDNADALLNLLGRFKFDLFIHGHKHDPLIRYHNTTEDSYRIPIFSSGSFSSYSNLMFTSMRNSFHILTIQKDTVCKGIIDTWTFLPNSGWNKNYDENAFPPKSGFGNLKSLNIILEEIKEVMNEIKEIKWDDLIIKIPDILFLIPSESIELDKLLRSNKLISDSPLGNDPKVLYNVS